MIWILFLSRGCSLPTPHQGLLWWPECSRVTAGKKGQIGLQLTLLTLPSEGSHEAVRSRAEGLWTWPSFCPTASPRSQPLTTSKHRSDHTDLSPWLLHGSYSDSMGQAVLDNLCPHCRFMRKGTFQLVFGGWGGVLTAKQLSIEILPTVLNSFLCPSICTFLLPPQLLPILIIPNCLAFLITSFYICINI